MTEKNPNDKTIGRRTVDNVLIETSYDSKGQTLYTITSEKFNSPIIVKKTNDGFSFYEVEMKVGHLADSLKGRYTKPDLAVSDVLKYIKTAKVSKAKQRDLNYAKNHASATEPDNKELVQ